MLEAITLGQVFTVTQNNFPQLQHDAQKLQEAVMLVLNKDPIRTTQLRKGIEVKELDFEFKKQWTLNDIFAGMHNYLVALGIREHDKNLKSFMRQCMWEGLLFSSGEISTE